MTLTSRRYMWATALLFGLLLLKINGVIYRTVKDNQCERGNAQACKVAANWGYAYKPLPPIGSPGRNKATCENIGCQWIPSKSGGWCLCG